MTSKIHLKQGFTLLELALVIAIIGIVLGGIFVGQGAFFESNKYQEDQRRLMDIKSALLHHVAVDGYLPCPDTDGDGQQNRTNEACSDSQGFLPHADLKTHAVNAYSYPFFYAINTDSTDDTKINDEGSSASYFGASDCDPDNTANGNNPPCFNLKTPQTVLPATDDANNLFVCGDDQTDCTSINHANLARFIPLIVVSFGKNSSETWGNSTDGTPACPTTLSTREQTNCTHDRYFHRAPQNRDGTNQFDDVLIWLTAQEIKQKLPSVLIASNFGRLSGDGGGSQILPPTIDNEFPSEPTQTELNTQYTPIDGTSSTDVDTINGGKKGTITDQVYITGDATQTINLYQGTDTIYIAGDLDARLNADQHTKTIFVKGNVTTNGYINIDGNHGNYIEVGENNAGRIDVQGTGTNQIVIYGDVMDTPQSYITMTKGTANHLYIGGDILGNSGTKALVYGTIYLGKTAAEFGADLTRTLSRLSATTILCRQVSGSNNFVPCIWL